eukprot:8758424-Lingulodinium_polyedra.AAC.1
MRLRPYFQALLRAKRFGNVVRTARHRCNVAHVAMRSMRAPPYGGARGVCALRSTQMCSSGDAVPTELRS